MTKWTVEDIPSQMGKLAVVTGANSGIGWHTALELARAGGEVILPVRSETKGREAVARIREQLPQAQVRWELLDLASLKSIETFAGKVNKEAKLDLLVNNAGVMAVPRRELTVDGFERQLGTNFLGPFALTSRLMPVLLRSDSPRVTTVASGAASMGLRRINFEDMQWEKSYGPWKAYCQSKLADVMLMLELGKRSAAAGVSLLSNGAHPGYARTNLQTSGPGKEQNTAQLLFERFASQDAAHGALPTLRAATASDAAAGSYYAPDRFLQLKGDPVAVAFPKPALNDEAARQLWEIAERLTGVRFSFGEQASLKSQGSWK